MEAVVVASAVAEPSSLKSFQDISLVMSKPTGILLDLWYDDSRKEKFQVGLWYRYGRPIDELDSMSRSPSLVGGDSCGHQELGICRT